MTRHKALRLPEPTLKAICGIGVWLAALTARSRRLASARRLYLLVTPLGMPARGWLEAELNQRGLPILTRAELDDWPRISTAVQVRRHDTAHLRRAILYESAWSALFPRAHALAWGFEPKLHPQLVAAKAALRAGVARLALTVGPLPDDLCVLHGFHLADAGDAAAEARRLEAALG